MREKLQGLRKEKKLTQAQVAEVLNISTNHYQAIELGTKQGSITIWDKLEDIFEVHQRDLRVQKMPGCNQAKKKEV